MEWLLLTPIIVFVGLSLLVGAVWWILLVLDQAGLLSIFGAIGDAATERRANRIAGQARAELAARRQPPDSQGGFGG